MTTALVLGGGGVTGIGWEIGVLEGLARAGVHLADADIVIGTSAGSVVGTQLTGGLPTSTLYDDQLAPPDAEIGSVMGMATMLRIALPMLLPGSPEVRLRRLGRAALRAHPESAEQRLEVIRSRIGVTSWPAGRDLRITAINAATGQFRVLTGSAGVDLVAAVGASCAVPMVWPPVPIDGAPHIDGGMRSVANADLAAGADRVVVLAPLPRSMDRHHAIPAQLGRLGAHVRSAVLSPDREALAAIGKNLLDPARRADAARSGLRQGAAAAADVRAAWADA